MSNDGLSSATFIDGAMKGYQFMQGVDDHKKQVGLRDAQEQRAQESHNEQMENNKQSQQINSLRFKQLSEQDQQNTEALFWRKQAALDGVGKYSDQDDKDFKTLTGGSRLADPEYIGSDKMSSALDTWHKVRAGEMDYNDPAAIDAANVVINAQRGAKDGRTVKISRVIPSSDGSGIHFALDSIEADGTVNKNRPLTDNRSSDPNDTASTLSIDELDHVFGTAAQVNQAVRNPKVREAMYKLHGIRTDGEADVALARRAKEADIDYKTANTEYLRSGKGKGGLTGEHSTANMKDIEYLVSKGVAEDEAVDRVYNRGESPSQSITSMATRIYESSKDDDGKPSITMETAAQEASKAYALQIKQSGNRKPPQSEPTAQPAAGTPPPRDPAAFTGKSLKNPSTGETYVSDGKSWKKI